MGWADLLPIVAPIVGNGVGAAAFAVVWTARAQINDLKNGQDATNRLIQRLVKIHCEKYPDEAYEIMHDGKE